VRDIVAYRTSVPPSISPAMIANEAKRKFGWRDIPVVTTEKYVHGVVSGHDFAKRRMIDELKVLTKSKPKDGQDAFKSSGWLTEWLEKQDRPKSPDQTCED